MSLVLGPEDEPEGGGLEQTEPPIDVIERDSGGEE
jgi:hypothetical protein